MEATSATARPPRNEKKLTRVSHIAAAWAFFYACYRWYYAAGGTIGMFGVPVSIHQWRTINAIGGTIILVMSLLPIALLPLWRRSRLQPVLLGLCWTITVGCVTHSLVGLTQRVLSLSGVYAMPFPFWQTIDRRASDLQALFFNEPWFLIEGLLWATIAWRGALADSPRRDWWTGSAVAAAGLLTITGLLSAFGVIGKFIVG